MKLNAFLREKNLDDAAFGQAVQASAGAVKKWRYGERMPRPHQLDRIREATGGAVTAEDFVTAARERATGAAA